MDVNRLIGAPADGVLPAEVAPIVHAILEGRIAQLVVIAQTTDGNVLSAFPTIEPDACNRFAMLGAFDVVKRDYMREHIEARIAYEPRDR